MKQQLKGEGLLFLAALIWGVSFVFQKTGMSGREITGCVIMFIALLLVQITDIPKTTDTDASPEALKRRTK